MKSYTKRLFRRRQKFLTNQQIVTLSFDKDKVYYSLIEESKSKPQILKAGQINVDGIQDLSEKLSSLKHQIGLDAKPCKIILSLAHYQIFLLNNLGIPYNEINAAAKWKLKDRLASNLQDTSIDSMPIYRYQSVNDIENYYIFAISTQLVKNIVSPIESLGLKVEMITTPEIPLANLASHDVNGVFALLYVAQEKVILLISDEKRVYLLRHLPLFINDEQDLKKLVDELQQELMRSVNYCRDQYDLPIINQIICLNSESHIQEAIQLLAEQTQCQYRLLNLFELTQSPIELSNEIYNPVFLHLGLCRSFLSSPNSVEESIDAVN